jgi:hypothetical protein
LQLLYNGLGTPAWVALVPQEIAGKELDDVMTANGRAENVSHYEMPNGDVVYVGTPQASELSEVMAGSGGSKYARRICS